MIDLLLQVLLAVFAVRSVLSCISFQLLQKRHKTLKFPYTMGMSLFFIPIENPRQTIRNYPKGGFFAYILCCFKTGDFLSFISRYLEIINELQSCKLFAKT